MRQQVTTLNQVELRAALRVRGLNTHGTTQELEARLARDDACGFFLGNLDNMSNDELGTECQRRDIPSRVDRVALIERIRVYNQLRTERPGMVSTEA
ncbi:hypothetical protein IMSHALPRED_008408 [Imshaugia aleurites]|uniref:SAP domain-containing protein n=1 Tax=Imshaugia aleurites TaxID=172621 RepID=A0A8H3EMW0_9LECA|nr:hypothetical protein IMSHALPRED_008408 [Imshaugia aleurites]